LNCLAMFGLSYIGAVNYSTWMKNWRYAIVVAFFIALLISPRATAGLMETTIGLTLSALCFVGALLSKGTAEKVHHECMLVMHCGLSTINSEQSADIFPPLKA